MAPTTGTHPAGARGTPGCCRISTRHHWNYASNSNNLNNLIEQNVRHVKNSFGLITSELGTWLFINVRTCLFVGQRFSERMQSHRRDVTSEICLRDSLKTDGAGVNLVLMLHSWHARIFFLGKLLESGPHQFSEERGDWTGFLN